MTQSFNLSQLANNVNTSGLLNAAAGLYNQVPVANGGTGVATVASGAILVGAGTSAMTAVPAATSGNVLTANGTTWVSQTASGGTPIVRIYTSPSPWTKPATLKAIKVTVVGGGGGGGGTVPITGINTGGGGGGAVAFGYFQAPAIPGPVTVTVGATAPGGTGASGTAGNPSSFGALVSCTGGGAGLASSSAVAGGAGGTVTTTPQIYGVPGTPGGASALTGSPTYAPSGRTHSYSNVAAGVGGNTAFGYGIGGGALVVGTTPTPTYSTTTLPGLGYGGGGAANVNPSPSTGGNGTAGIVIVEEFY